MKRRLLSAIVPCRFVSLGPGFTDNVTTLNELIRSDKAHWSYSSESPIPVRARVAGIGYKSLGCHAAAIGVKNRTRSPDHLHIDQNCSTLCNSRPPRILTGQPHRSRQKASPQFKVANGVTYSHIGHKRTYPKHGIMTTWHRSMSITITRA